MLLKGRFGGFVCVLVGLLLTPAMAHAQSSTTGAIAGVARDATGAVLPGVTVEAASPALIEKVRIAVTDDQGNYKIVDLRPGTYTVSFTLPGFSTFKREGIELTTGFTATANADMRVGALEETVTVTGSSPVVDVQNVRTQTVLSQAVMDALPTPKSLAGYTSLTLGATAWRRPGGTADPLVDVGGGKGDYNMGFSVHGTRAADSKQTFDGLSLNSLNASGASRTWVPNYVAIQEVVMGTGAASAEIETGGIQLNLVPKEGGNTFTYYFSTLYTNEHLQQDNLDAEIRSRGLTSVPGVKNIYDFGGGVGGRIVRDKLWFYGAGRTWAAWEYLPGVYYNKSTNPFVFEADLSRPGYNGIPARDASVRFTWQVNAKHKMTFGNGVNYNCQCPLFLLPLQSPESAPDAINSPMQFPHATWNYPVSNRLLVEAGFSYGHFPTVVNNNPSVPGAARVQELSTGLVWGNNDCCGAGQALRPWSNNPLNQRFSVSYVGGSHALKVGQQHFEGFWRRDGTLDPPFSYTLLNGRPQSLTQYAVPHENFARVRSMGLYGQDQWTLKRVTLNLGVRYDHFWGWVPAGTRPGGRFAPPFSFDRVENSPNWKDVTPRLGAAYDLFGNGKTAIKGSVGRYLSSVGADLAMANSPANSIVISSARTWSDANGNLVPECDFQSFTANGECGPLANSRFGQPFRNSFLDKAILEGWGVRPYSWQATVSVQHELRPNVALNVGYFRTDYANFWVTDNELVAPADFDPFCITAPSDPRLPGGGGNQLCGLYDVSRARFGQVQSLRTEAKRFGDQEEHYDGVDVAINARFGRQGLLQGGVSFGKQVMDTCPVVDSPQQARPGFCRSSPPWSAGTQYKFSGNYPLPWWGLETSFSFQNLPGVALQANYTVPNAAITPSLGRNLSSCPAIGACTAAASVPLIPLGTMFLDRVTQLDLRFTKGVQIARARVKGSIDLYNVFNANTVLSVNPTYGPAWQRPLTIMGGRMVKFGGQLNF